MSDEQGAIPPDQQGEAAVADGMDAPARLDGLMRDLETLRQYLEERGRHTYELAQRFMANARRDSSSRAYDERQATMLEYQHYIWHEIAGRVAQLLTAYGEPPDMDAESSGEAQDAGDGA
jgi:hypothetical protein